MINLKGGVGKTTLAVGMACELAKNYDVLLVDIDPQFNATQWIVPAETYLDWIENKKTVFDIFQPSEGDTLAARRRNAASLSNAVITVTPGGYDLDIVPSTLDLIKLDHAPRGTENRLRVFLEPARQKYDYILIDCPPTASIFSYSAFLASDAYLVPVKPDPLSVLGLPLLERAMGDYEDRSGQGLMRLGLIFTQVRQTEAMRKTMAQVRRDYPDEVFNSHLVQTTGVAEAVDAGKPPQDFHKSRPKLMHDLEDICQEFIERVDNL
ncbi:ParA family protein [Luteimonas soli]|uniref:ParA family protein n=1 Tax=Luteimonas soli TaxID=1648966 RepID=A0ABV7XKH8_9GAMM